MTQIEDRRRALDRWALAGGLVGLGVLLAQGILPGGLVGETGLLLALLPVVVAAAAAGTSDATPRGRAFRQRIQAMAATWWLSALLAALAGADLVVVPALAIDTLRLLGYIGLFLAIDLRPHRRSGGASPGLVRQLQLAGFLFLLLCLAVYGPGLALGGLGPWDRGLVDLFLALFLATLASERKLYRWRSFYVRFALSLALLALAGFAAADGPAWLVSIATAAALALLAGVARGRLAEPKDAQTKEPPRERRVLHFDVPLVATASVLPALHLGFHVAGLELPAAEPGPFGDPGRTRDILALVALGGLGVLALVEHVLLRRRSSWLDIERRRATEEGEERSIYLASLMEHSPLAIVVLDPEHIVRLCNPAFEALFGYTADEVVGTSLDRLIAPGERQIEANGYTRRVLAGEAVHDTTLRLRRDGTPVSVEIHGVPLVRGGRLVGIFALYQDVTERIVAEEALKESEERFRRLSDATFEGIVVSENGRIVDCNEQYARLVGLPQSEVVGRPVIDFVSPEDRELVRERMASDFEQPYEHRALRADRSVRVVEVHGRAVPWRGCDVRVTAVRDMTEHRRFEEEVRQSQKMEAVGRLAGGIAHDFNNLLTVIKGYGQLLAMQIRDESLGDLVEEVLQATERASLMTQRLLAFGRKQTFQPQTLDLADVLRSMEKLLRRLIRADIELSLEIDPDAGRARVDPSQLEQVILNLAINAADAMPAGGDLVLALDAVELDEEAARRGPLAAPGKYLRLRVRDTGTGMDEATRSQVFEPFFTTKDKGKGTGLGLATVYAIVHQSGGAIDVESEVGEGSEFRIYLPRVPEAPTVAEASSGEASADPGDLPRGEETVLVVEDEPGVRILAREFLELYGYRVHVASDGREGLQRLEEIGEDIDLVLTDVVMPGMNGPEMVRRLRAERPEARVLYMSGYTDEVLERTDPEANVLLVHKPFSVEELVLKVREILDGEAPEAPEAAAKPS